MTNGHIVFDWHGYSTEKQFLGHYFKRYHFAYPGWDADLVPLEVDLTSQVDCLSVGMNSRGTDQDLHDPIPRAQRFLTRFEQQHRERLLLKLE